jgi:hypothetical protein
LDPTDNTVKTLTLSNGMTVTTTTENADGSTTETTSTYYFKAEKVHLGLESIYVVDNMFQIKEVNGEKVPDYYFSKGIEYQSGKPLTAIYPQSTTKLSYGLTSKGASKGSPVFTLSSKGANSEFYSDAYWYAWSFSKDNNSAVSNAYTVTGNTGRFSYDINADWSGIDFNSYYHTTKLFFDPSLQEFSTKIKNYNYYNHAEGAVTDEQKALHVLPTFDGAADSFLIFRVDDPNAPVSVPGNNWEIAEENPLSFDASTHVLFYNGATYDANGDRTNTNSYTITPIRQLEWNDGNGAYLEQLNHAIKLSSATTDNLTLKSFLKRRKLFKVAFNNF